MKKCFLSLSLVFIFVFAFAEHKEKSVNNKQKNQASFMNADKEQFVIKGKVTDFLSGEPLTGVKVTIVGTNTTVYSDFDGNFRFSDIHPGKINLSTSYVSYNNGFVEITADGKKSNEISLKIQPAL